MPKMMQFSENVINVFTEMDTDYEQVKNLMFDLYNGELDGVSKREAEDKLREVSLKIFGLTKDSSKRDRKRAYRDHAREYFDVIEEVVDWTVSTGLRENEWFNSLTNYKNLAEGDENLFVNDGDDTILAIAKMGKRHHDTILQRLAGKSTYSVETDLYGAAVGADIDLYLIGREDFSKLINKLTEAFIITIQDTIFAAIKSAVNELPTTGQSQFIGTGALSSSTKAAFDKILQNVSIANDNQPVRILGTMLGLQNLENLISVDWVADSSKEQVASESRLGNYGRYEIVEIPQRFKRNDVTDYEYDNDVLYIFAGGDNENKMIDFVDVGETLIDENSERGRKNNNMDDLMSYEIQREFGCSVRLGRWFGQWTITS